MPAFVDWRVLLSTDTTTTSSRRGSAATYEYRMLRLGPGTSRGETRRFLTEQAEYGKWELARTRLYAGGERRVWLRRKIIRVQSTL